MSEENKVVEFDYVNYRGERAVRRAIPLRFYFAAAGTESHPGPGWFMSALDLGKDQIREFALADAKFRRPENPTPTG